MAGKEDRIVKCLRCYTCMAERPMTFTRRCAVNPLIGREIEGMEVLPARQSKKVMVVGGGLAGCECAIHLGMEGKKVEHHQGHLRGLSRRPGYLATHGTCVPVSPKSVSNVSFVSRFFCITAGVKFPINI